MESKTHSGQVLIELILIILVLTGLVSMTYRQTELVNDRLGNKRIGKTNEKR